MGVHINETRSNNLTPAIQTGAEALRRRLFIPHVLDDTSLNQKVARRPGPPGPSTRNPFSSKTLSEVY